jgi:hypothetical protein
VKPLAGPSLSSMIKPELMWKATALLLLDK